jgi:uncharacterized membrane protein (DUF106 family)
MHQKFIAKWLMIAIAAGFFLLVYQSYITDRAEFARLKQIHQCLTSEVSERPTRALDSAWQACSSDARQ